MRYPRQLHLPFVERWIRSIDGKLGLNPRIGLSRTCILDQARIGLQPLPPSHPYSSDIRPVRVKTQTHANTVVMDRGQQRNLSMQYDRNINLTAIKTSTTATVTSVNTISSRTSPHHHHHHNRHRHHHYNYHHHQIWGAVPSIDRWASRTCNAATRAASPSAPMSTSCSCMFSEVRVAFTCMQHSI